MICVNISQILQNDKSDNAFTYANTSSPCHLYVVLVHAIETAGLPSI